MPRHISLVAASLPGEKAARLDDLTLSIALVV